ncbi:hypothetical protein C8R43DRAFT_1127548 [Mycena crocata]|nr:hypothetical protein C8R43DRAFT_1127548 [Mycena crocata]
MQNGTLVVQTENRLYRVFSGILAAKSPVFSDMFAFPQPEGGETLDGCPLVRLMDTALDTTYFLKAIFHYDFFDAYPSNANFDVVAGILRLSHKYQVDPLKKRALIHVSNHFPADLEEWEGREDWDCHAIPLVSLAREVSADWILPIALFACTGRELQEILQGVTIRGDHCSLSQADILLCIRALHEIETTWTSRMLSFFLTPTEIPFCTTPEICLAARTHFRHDSEHFRTDKIIVLFLVNDDEDWDILKDAGACGACLRFMQAAHISARSHFWHSLPGIFGLPDWNVLRDQQRDALK